jgi:hypothetical protein
VPLLWAEGKEGFLKEMCQLRLDRAGCSVLFKVRFSIELSNMILLLSLLQEVPERRLGVWRQRASSQNHMR